MGPGASTSVIDLAGVTKVYQMGDVQVHALCGVSLRVEAGEIMSIMGPSGSGKSTLMNIIGCLDQPTAGEYRLEGRDVGSLNDDQLAEIRNRRIGFVFQTFNLLARTTALENVMLPRVYAGVPRGKRRQQAQDALVSVGLADRMSHTPNELSGGQQQRVAIARALVNDPAILLADEPTGNLDSTSGTEVMALLQSLNRDRGITVILVTHDAHIAQHTGRIVYLHDGLITDVEQVAKPVLAAAGGENA
jgi:putative ABC transport system ATP-binding protein